MSTSYDPQLLEAARAGNEDAFRQLVEPFRREILGHCYRMMGSLHEAEDLVQDTMLRAWRGLASFEGRSSVRTWLHRIATNATLDALDARVARGLPPSTRPPSGPGENLPPVSDPIWLEPFPDMQLVESGPDAIVSARESISLAFLELLQRLAPKQRVALLAVDVLGLTAEETAELLETSVAASNSLVQRARETIAARRPVRAAESDAERARLLEQYVRAWETSDIAVLVSLLKDDAKLSMPPMPAWYLGRDAIAASLSAMILVPGSAGKFRMIPTRANGLPAFGTYKCDESGIFQPLAIQTTSIDGDRIAEIVAFIDPTLFASFGLPATG